LDSARLDGDFLALLNEWVPPERKPLRGRHVPALPGEARRLPPAARRV